MTNRIDASLLSHVSLKLSPHTNSMQTQLGEDSSVPACYSSSNAPAGREPVTLAPLARNDDLPLALMVESTTYPCQHFDPPGYPHWANKPDPIPFHHSLSWEDLLEQAGYCYWQGSPAHLPLDIPLPSIEETTC